VVVVFDNNVVISAAMFWTSIPAQALLKARKNNHIILSSRFTLAELRTTILNPKFDKYVSLSKRIGFCETYESDSQIIPITTNILACRDPKDNMFLELAVSGNATYIITGDNDLLALNPFHEIKIISPKEFVEKL
jgi:putative PIN family toxin of toxin-antitoxin system